MIVQDWNVCDEWEESKHLWKKTWAIEEPYDGYEWNICEKCGEEKQFPKD